MTVTGMGLTRIRAGVVLALNPKQQNLKLKCWPNLPLTIQWLRLKPTWIRKASAIPVVIINPNCWP